MRLSETVKGSSPAVAMDTLLHPEQFPAESQAVSTNW
jgi:hypothetical protein